MPDHDFPVGERHKLIPSVYAACNMKEGKVSFSGPTYIAIRSARHDKSTAKTHQFDFDKLTQLDEFNTSIKNKRGEMKPLIFVAVDGGPDESPSNQVGTFQLKLIILDFCSSAKLLSYVLMVYLREIGVKFNLINQ